MPVLDTPAMDNMADASSSPQDSSVRPEQLEWRYPLRERKPPQKFYYSLLNLSGNFSRDFRTSPC